MNGETIQLRIRSAKDLFDAVKSPDPAVRFGVLRAMAQNPAKAASYGAYGGMDVVDLLCEQAVALPPSLLRTMVLGTLGGFRDPRTATLFKKELSMAQDAEIITLSARFLSTEPEEDVHALFSSFLMQDNSPPHARSAANAMARFTGLADAERIRIALLADADFDAPLLDEHTEAFWLKELAGPLGGRARELIESQGEPAFRLLKQRWETLPEDAKEWLLRWGAAVYPAFTIELILLGLDSGRVPLVKTSLECIASLGAAGKMFETLTGRYLSHSDSAVRIAAVRAGVAGLDWEDALAREENPAVKIEMVGKLPDARGIAAVPALVHLVEDGDFRLRAAATAALQRLGNRAVEGVKPLMEHPAQSVKLAAAQVLIAAGEDLWLEKKMLASSLTSCGSAP